MFNAAVNSATYYRNREQAERTLADQAVSEAIRQIHLEMAERYGELAEQLEIGAVSQSQRSGTSHSPNSN
jgi:hypothetical protein